MSLLTPDASRGQLVALTFMQDDLAASQTDVALVISEGNTGSAAATNAVNSIVMPFAGEIVAISARLSAAATAGQLTAGATINGTEKTVTTMTITTQQSAYKRVPRDTVKFNAGDRIGAEISTNASWNGTTADLVVTVWCLVRMEGI
jgi:hypothetical protein